MMISWVPTAKCWYFIFRVQHRRPRVGSGHNLQALLGAPHIWRFQLLHNSIFRAPPPHVNWSKHKSRFGWPNFQVLIFFFNICPVLNSVKDYTYHLVPVLGLHPYTHVHFACTHVIIGSILLSRPFFYKKKNCEKVNLIVIKWFFTIRSIFFLHARNL